MTFWELMNSMSTIRLALACCLLCSVAVAEDFQLHTFERQQLTDIYYSEGANAGDLNGDGIPDAVYGPYWYAGPKFEEQHEIYPPVPQNVNGYSDNFFSWVYDFNGDGRNDVLAGGFPGTAAYVYENPGKEGFDKHWKKHLVFDIVGNEAPQFVNMFGDATPELVCTREGFFGFATVDPANPFGTWKFHAISDNIAGGKFGHGLGIGDINGDGRQDIMYPGGWFEQPAEKADSDRWLFHEVKLSSAYGGAEMYAYDVDGDGDNDIITSLAAHDYGLAWYEQVQEDDEIAFKQHLIMGTHPSENKYGVLFTELHSVNLADIDGDGLKDIVTGKTYWSHHKGSPMWDAGAVTYWFRLTRTKEGVDYVPYLADGEAGIGRQLSVVDVNNDGLLDMVLGGMKGGHVLLHKVQKVSEKEWQAAQPKVYEGEKLPIVENVKASRGPKSPIDPATGRVKGAIEGEALANQATAGNPHPQEMGNFPLDRWSNASQMWWIGGKPGDKLTFTLPEFSGKVDVELVLTCARDYGIVQLLLDDQKLGEPIDLYNPEVITTGVLSFPGVEVKGNKHTLTAQIVGANPKAAKAYMFALDYIRVKQADGNYVAGPKVDAPESFSKLPTGIKPKSAEGKELNLDFETGDLADWTAEGDAFADQPVKGDTVAPRRGDMRSAHAGDFWIGGYEKYGDERVGTLTSAPFVVSQPYASFLANGGEHENTRVELVRKDSGDVIYKISGQNSESLRQVVVDLRAHVGKELMIRLVDQNKGGWGHVNFDHFRLHESRPAAVTPPLIALVPDEYPYGGQTAPEAAANMKLPEGFKVLVGAAEPDVKQPIAMALDDRGRVWIAEAYEYPQRAKGDKGRDRILIFEDTDGNGSLDKQTVFYEGLNLVSGLEVGFGGVWVGAAPYLMFIPDSNGDDIPDMEPKILLDGWAWQDTHETLNAFIWGPDGWLYGCHGVFTHSLVGKPGTPDDKRQPINAGVWRYHPTRHEFEVFAHGTSNPWGVDFNDHGQAFVTACVIPHLYHIIQGGRYQRQAGQHFNQYTYKDIVTIADHLHYLGATPHGGNSKSDAAGGGHAHSGAMFYLGGKWPQELRNQLFMNNIHGQRLNMDIMEPQGSGYVGHHGPDFLLTGDKASQILNFRYGPDGQAWMIDWYDMQACHHGDASIHDRSNGRIYKIVYGELEPHAPVNLAKLSDLNLAEFVRHSNDWYVRHASRLLQERAARGTISQDALDRLLVTAQDHSDETRRLRAAWALHRIGRGHEKLIPAMLQDPSPYVRAWAVQLATEQDDGTCPQDLHNEFVKLAQHDPSPVVRLYLASLAQRLDPVQRWPLLEALITHPEDASDHNLPLMYWYAAEPMADVDTTRALALAMSAGESIPLIREFMLRRIGSSDAASALAALVDGLGTAKSSELQLTFLGAIRAALRGQRKVAAPDGWAKVSATLLASEVSDVRLQATALGVTFGDPAALKSMRAQVADTKSDSAARLVALQSLLDANDAELAPTLLSLLQTEGVLKEAAIRGLAQYDQPEVAPALLGIYTGLNPEQKRMTLGTLCARSGSGVALLKAIEQKKVSGTDLTADLVRQLQFLKNAEISRLLEDVWGSVKESAADKLAMIAATKDLVASTKHPVADPELGRAVFAKTCLKCHTLYGVGNKIGPDLTGSNRANLDYLVSNIVDPSAVMAKEYRPTVLLLNDGRVVTGLVKAEDNKSVTIQTSDSQIIVPKNEIEERAESEKSMMPDDQLRQFSEHEVRSLIAYLQGKQQVPVLATAENIVTFFNGQDLTGWSGTDGLWSVENGEMVGRTEGLKRNEWIVSDLALQNFKLTVDVKLVNNEGNSGIQFRSSAHEGEVSGYQADIGAGWWGKLYEEHGRALLWDKSGEEHLKPGEWNTYEVIANGHHVQTFLNGKPCVDLEDPKGATRGIIAFQLHSGGKTEVRYKNMKVELLP